LSASSLDGQTTLMTWILRPEMKRSAEPGTAQGTPTKARNRTAQGRHSFRSAAKHCLCWIQEPFGSGWSFPSKQDLTHTSQRVLSAADVWPRCSVCSPPSVSTKLGGRHSARRTGIVYRGAIENARGQIGFSDDRPGGRPSGQNDQLDRGLQRSIRHRQGGLRSVERRDSVKERVDPFWVPGYGRWNGTAKCSKSCGRVGYPRSSCR
jgi:hypothetical protein